MIISLIFMVGLASTLCYIECFVTDLVYKNNQYGKYGRQFFFLSVLFWGVYHFLTH